MTFHKFGVSLPTSHTESAMMQWSGTRLNFWNSSSSLKRVFLYSFETPVLSAAVLTFLVDRDVRILQKKEAGSPQQGFNNNEGACYFGISIKGQIQKLLTKYSK